MCTEPGRTQPPPSCHSFWAHLFVRRHGSTPSGLSDLLSQCLVVVSSAGLLAEAPRLPVGIDAPQLVLTFSGRQLKEEWIQMNSFPASFDMGPFELSMSVA